MNANWVRILFIALAILFWACSDTRVQEVPLKETKEVVLIKSVKGEKKLQDDGWYTISNISGKIEQITKEDSIFVKRILEHKYDYDSSIMYFTIKKYINHRDIVKQDVLIMSFHLKPRQMI